MDPYTVYGPYSQVDEDNEENLLVGVPNLARILRPGPRLMIRVTQQLDQISLAGTSNEPGYRWSRLN